MNNLREKWMHRLLMARYLTLPPRRIFSGRQTRLNSSGPHLNRFTLIRTVAIHRTAPRGTALQYTAVHGTEANRTEAMLTTLEPKTNNQANRVPNLDDPSAATDEAHEQRVQACRRAPPDGTRRHREVYIRRNNKPRSRGRSVKVGVSDKGNNRVGDERLAGGTRGGFDNTLLCAPSAQLTY